jgi:predicted glycoside hydrolase/deacetylase ChbG (UPF0249 family)
MGGAIGPRRNLTLIVNADDLGLSAGVNAGVFESHARGIVTSASLMVGRPAAAAAAEEAQGHPGLAIGLHLDLDDVEPVPAAIRAACDRQLDAFESLLGRRPTHLDSHHHVHMKEPAASVAGELADGLGVPLRDREVRYEGGFFARSDGRPAPDLIAPERLVALIESLPEGWTELGCHPGRGVGVAETSYAGEREVELRSLCDPRVATAIAENRVELRSFADVRPADLGLPPRCSLDSGGDGGL